MPIWQARASDGEGSRVERWRGGLGRPCVLLALSSAGASFAWNSRLRTNRKEKCGHACSLPADELPVERYEFVHLFFLISVTGIGKGDTVYKLEMTFYPGKNERVFKGPFDNEMDKILF